MTFGYAQGEVVAALINLTTLLIIGFYLLVEAINRFADPQPIEGWTVIAVAGVALVIDLVTAFLDQFDLQQARLRIEITRTQSCPKFHSDNVHIRLVTTYLGPTTEYQYAGTNEIHTAPLGGLVFLKGHGHPNHRDTVHHRSPEVPVGEKRLCVAIDY